MKLSYGKIPYIGILLIAGILSIGCGDQNDTPQPPEEQVQDPSILEKEQPGGGEENVSIDPNGEPRRRVGVE